MPRPSAVRRELDRRAFLAASARIVALTALAPLAACAPTSAVKVERDLNELVPKKDWTIFSHRMIYHGRQICLARKPRCTDCTLAKLCPKIGVDD